MSKAVSVSVASSNQAALLAELGIVQWRARPGRAFPRVGAYAMPHAEAVVEQPIVQPDSNVAQTNIEPLFDVCIYANTALDAEAELLARIIQAAHGLRGALRIQSVSLDTPQQPAQAHLRLDDVDFPSPATMVAQPSTKRVLWQALQETVGRLS